MYNSQRGGNFQENCAKTLIGEIVLTRYNNKTYRIDDFDWNQNPTSKFKLHDGSETSFVEYYQKHHKIEIHDLKQPLIVHRPKKRDMRPGQEGPLLLLPELCTLTGLTDAMRADFQVMKDIAVHTRVPPEGRWKSLQGFIEKISQHEEVQKEIQGWQLRFAPNLQSLKGRVLPPEKIIQVNGSYTYRPADADWSREMRGQKLINSVSLENWVLIFTRRDNNKAQEFYRTLTRVGPPMGIQIRQPNMVELPDDNTNSYLQALKSNINPNLQMVVCLLPSNRKDRYDAIKKLCCIEAPVPSQCITGRSLNNPKSLMSVVTKIAIQLNCKLGGEVWQLEIPLANMMVCGIDTYHDSQRKGQSVGALVCSLNKACTRYISQVCFQASKQELIDGLMVNFTGALKKYHALNGALPERIIVYRDGVGDGQLAEVAELEIPQLLACFKKMGEDYNPKVAVVVVKKRINTRFFHQTGPKNFNNPPPGTVIDTEVTRPEWYDFFLVSQAVRQGTVTPSHYNVVWDTTGLKPDHIQRLTYKLCHLYYNWPGTIRVPAPCQYAHKLAFLTGQSLHKDPAMALCDKLYYL